MISEQYGFSKMLFSIELEFFLISNLNQLDYIQCVENFQKSILHALKEYRNFIYFDTEDDENQHEIQFSKFTNITNLIYCIKYFQEKSFDIAKENKLELIMTAKPFIDRPGNSMQINFSIYDNNDKNLFIKADNSLSELCLYCINGLMNNAREMIDFVLKKSDQTVIYKFKRPDSKHIYYPTNVSWGMNNRTCMIRIPKSVNDIQNTRIEHRLPVPTVDFEALLELFCKNILNGIEKKITPIDPIWGNAFDAQYSHLESIL